MKLSHCVCSQPYDVFNNVCGKCLSPLKEQPVFGYQDPKSVKWETGFALFQKIGPDKYSPMFIFMDKFRAQQFMDEKKSLNPEVEYHIDSIGVDPNKRGKS